MPYCLYVRKSRADAEAEARGEGETLTRHINTLLEVAKRRRLEVTEIYKEIVSGETIASRPVMQHLLSEVGDGKWDGVLVMEIERLARGDTVDQGIVAQTFKFSNTIIITPLKDYNPNNEFDEEYFEFGLFMSRREYKTINRRLQRGRLASVKEGKYVGNKPPYGYDRVKIQGDKGYTLSPNPEEAEVVKLIYDLYVNGEQQEDGTYKRLGTSLIVRRLNDLKIKPRVNQSWSANTVRGILSNPVYIGKVRWNCRATSKKMTDGKITKSRPRAKKEDCIIVDGIHEPIIDSDTYKAAEQIREEKSTSPVKPNDTLMNPLAGIIICGKCGRHMVRRPYVSGRQDALICQYSSCKCVSSDLRTVEKHLIDSLRMWLVEYRVEWESGNKIKQDTSLKAKEKALQKLVSEHEILNKQLDTTHDLLEQGIYTTEQFLERVKKISEKLKKNETDSTELKAAIELEKTREHSRREIIPKIEKLLEVYDSVQSPSIKNEMLKEVLEKAVYEKEKSGRWHGSPEDFKLTLFPKLPRSE